MKIVGGAETYMFNLARALTENGIEVEFWGMEDKNNKAIDTYNCFARGIDFNTTKDFKSKLKESVNVIYSKQNRRRLAIILDEFKPDIVHIHNYNFQLTPSILSEIKKRGIKVVHTIHDSQLVCPNHRLYIPHKNEVCTKCLNKKYYNAPLNKCFDGSFSKSVIGSFESYLNHNLLNIYNKNIDAFISPSKFFKNLIQPVIKKNIIVLPNCVENKNLNYKSRKEDYILFFGRLSIEKGLHKLFEIFKHIDLKLKVIGKGDISSPGYENIEFLGPKYGDELFEYISNAKFTIHPSFWYENCPMTLVESYMVGTPVITSNHSGLKEMVTEDTGYLLDFYDANAINSLKKILSKPYHFESKKIISHYQDNYGEKVHLNKLLNIYKDILN
ncbi:glycosyltransferase [Jejuia spongiicola]|uniref:Glycosyltransferase n=1 Tax=Jejuia spongiicola TaxID=2942207 RepID=A0ABT0Q8Z0_9FLAO|nr:glycosyltransferase [Jejuia spongiicola]MCL6293420.1 glycosyltransferase [Jejuia spongiicola]